MTELYHTSSYPVALLSPSRAYSPARTPWTTRVQHSLPPPRTAPSFPAAHSQPPPLSIQGHKLHAESRHDTLAQLRKRKQQAYAEQLKQQQLSGAVAATSPVHSPVRSPSSRSVSSRHVDRPNSSPPFRTPKAASSAPITVTVNHLGKPNRVEASDESNKENMQQQQQQSSSATVSGPEPHSSTVATLQPYQSSRSNSSIASSRSESPVSGSQAGAASASTIAHYIRRFRETPPLSPSQRQQQQHMQLQPDAQFWWHQQQQQQQQQQHAAQQGPLSAQQRPQQSVQHRPASAPLSRDVTAQSSRASSLRCSPRGSDRSSPSERNLYDNRAKSTFGSGHVDATVRAAYVPSSYDAAVVQPSRSRSQSRSASRSTSRSPQRVDEQRSKLAAAPVAHSQQQRSSSHSAAAQIQYVPVPVYTSAPAPASLHPSNLSIAYDAPVPAQQQPVSAPAVAGVQPHLQLLHSRLLAQQLAQPHTQTPETVTTAAVAATHTAPTFHSATISSQPDAAASGAATAATASAAQTQLPESSRSCPFQQFQHNSSVSTPQPVTPDSLERKDLSQQSDAHEYNDQTDDALHQHATDPHEVAENSSTYSDTAQDAERSRYSEVSTALSEDEEKMAALQRELQQLAVEAAATSAFVKAASTVALPWPVDLAPAPEDNDHNGNVEQQQQQQQNAADSLPVSSRSPVSHASHSTHPPSPFRSPLSPYQHHSTQQQQISAPAAAFHINPVSSIPGHGAQQMLAPMHANHGPSVAAYMDNLFPAHYYPPPVANRPYAQTAAANAYLPPVFPPTSGPFTAPQAPFMLPAAAVTASEGDIFDTDNGADVDDLLSKWRQKQRSKKQGAGKRRARGARTETVADNSSDSSDNDSLETSYEAPPPRRKGRSRERSRPAKVDRVPTVQQSYDEHFLRELKDRLGMQNSPTTAMPASSAVCNDSSATATHGVSASTELLQRLLKRLKDDEGRTAPRQVEPAVVKDEVPALQQAPAAAGVPATDAASTPAAAIPAAVTNPVAAAAARLPLLEQRSEQQQVQSPPVLSEPVPAAAGQVFSNRASPACPIESVVCKVRDIEVNVDGQHNTYSVSTGQPIQSAPSGHAVTVKPSKRLYSPSSSRSRSTSASRQLVIHIEEKPLQASFKHHMSNSPVDVRTAGTTTHMASPNSTSRRAQHAVDAGAHQQHPSARKALFQSGDNTVPQQPAQRAASRVTAQPPVPIPPPAASPLRGPETVVKHSVNEVARRALFCDINAFEQVISNMIGVVLPSQDDGEITQHTSWVAEHEAVLPEVLSSAALARMPTLAPPVDGSLLEEYDPDNDPDRPSDEYLAQCEAQQEAKQADSINPIPAPAASPLPLPTSLTKPATATPSVPQPSAMPLSPVKHQAAASSSTDHHSTAPAAALVGTPSSTHAPALSALQSLPPSNTSDSEIDSKCTAAASPALSSASSPALSAYTPAAFMSQHHGVLPAMFPSSFPLATASTLPLSLSTAVAPFDPYTAAFNAQLMQASPFTGWTSPYSMMAASPLTSVMLAHPLQQLQQLQQLHQLQQLQALLSLQQQAIVQPSPSAAVAVALPPMAAALSSVHSTAATSVPTAPSPNAVNRACDIPPASSTEQYPPLNSSSQDSKPASSAAQDAAATASITATSAPSAKTSSAAAAVDVRSCLNEMGISIAEYKRDPVLQQLVHKFQQLKQELVAQR